MTIPGTTRQNGVSAQERLSALGCKLSENIFTEIGYRSADFAAWRQQASR